MLKHSLLFFILMVFLQTSFALSSEDHFDINRLKLSEGYEMNLPEQPEDPEQLKVFLKLSEEEKLTFYKNRQMILKYFSYSLTKKGVGRYIRWTKDKISTGVKEGRSLLRKSLSHAGLVSSPNISEDDLNEEGKTQELSLSLDRYPEDISEKEKSYVEQSVSAMVSNMWENISNISQGTGMGLSFVGGLVWNTNIGQKGFMWGRSLSADIGVNFHTGEGYIKFYYDRESLKKGGFALDIGLLMNTMIHLTDADLEKGDYIKATHTKLPPVGSYRRSDQFNGWGAQFGVHVGDVIGTVLASAGVPQGLMLLPAMRYLGFMTVYKSSLKRKSLGQIKLSKGHPLLKAFGFSESTDSQVSESSTLQCHSLL